MSEYGFEGNQTYPLVNGKKYIHSLVNYEGKYYCITNNKMKVRLLCIHYQGTVAKTILNDLNIEEVFS